MKKTIRLPLTPSATFVNPENPDWMAEISYVYISGADNEQGYEFTYNWESWPGEPGMGTLTDMIGLRMTKTAKNTTRALFTKKIWASPCLTTSPRSKTRCKKAVSMQPSFKKS